MRYFKSRESTFILKVGKIHWTGYTSAQAQPRVFDPRISSSLVRPSRRLSFRQSSCQFSLRRVPHQALSRTTGTIAPEPTFSSTLARLPALQHTDRFLRKAKRPRPHVKITGLTFDKESRFVARWGIDRDRTVRPSNLGQFSTDVTYLVGGYDNVPLLKGISLFVHERWTHLTMPLGNVYLVVAFKYLVTACTYSPRNMIHGMTRSTIGDN